jgi:L-asparagine transporter-like permease
MKSDWFVYTILQAKPVDTMTAAHIMNNASKQMALNLTTLAWQQQSQQLLGASVTDTHNDADTATTAITTVPLKLDIISLATVLRLACLTKAHRTAAKWLAKDYSGFVSYEALADIHSKQPLLRNTKGKHTIVVSSELIRTSLWHKMQSSILLVIVVSIYQ